MASSGNGKDLAALYIKRRAVLVTSFAGMKLVCSEESCGTTIPHSSIRGNRGSNPLGWADRHDDSFPPAEKREEAQKLFQRKIFLIE